MSVARLTERFRQGRPAIVLNGAGSSTESGIPDFRSQEATRRGGEAATLDDRAVVRIDGGAGETLSALGEELS